MNEMDNIDAEMDVESTYSRRMKIFDKIFKFSQTSPCYTLGETLWQEEFKTVKIIQIGHL